MKKALLIILLLFLLILGYGCKNNNEDNNNPNESGPTIDEPSTDDPTVDEPTNDDPIIEDPTTDEPVIDEPEEFDGKLTEEEMRKAIYDITKGDNSSLYIELTLSGKENGVNISNTEKVIIKRDGYLYSVYEMPFVEYNVNKTQY